MARSRIALDGLPHSEIPGSKPVCGSPGLIAAYHVLHRRPAPRHPPYALSSLTTTFTLLKVHQSCWIDALYFAISGSSVVNEPGHAWPVTAVHRHRRMLPGAASAGGLVLDANGGADRDRTGDLRLARAALSQLSYSPGRMVGLSGFEPLTSRLSAVRSSQLSYRPVAPLIITARGSSLSRGLWGLEELASQRASPRPRGPWRVAP